MFRSIAMNFVIVPNWTQLNCIWHLTIYSSFEIRNNKLLAFYLMANGSVHGTPFATEKNDKSNQWYGPGSLVLDRSIHLLFLDDEMVALL